MKGSEIFNAGENFLCLRANSIVVGFQILHAGNLASMQHAIFIPSGN